MEINAMGYLTLYNPFRDIERYMSSAALPWEWLWDEPSSTTSLTYDNKVDITKDNENVYIRVLVPEFVKDELTISVEGNTLTINGKFSKESKNRAFSKEFTRSWALSENQDASKITSKLENGVLTVTVPYKTPEKKLDNRRLISIE